MTRKTFTFKYHPASSGLSAVGNHNRGSDIKYGGKTCGFIIAPNSGNRYNRKPDGSGENEYSFMLHVNDPESNGWRNVELNHRDKDEKALRQWIRDHTQSIMNRYDIHFLEN